MSTDLAPVDLTLDNYEEVLNRFSTSAASSQNIILNIPNGIKLGFRQESVGNIRRMRQQGTPTEEFIIRELCIPGSPNKYLSDELLDAFYNMPDLKINNSQNSRRYEFNNLDTGKKIVEALIKEANLRGGKRSKKSRKSRKSKKSKKRLTRRRHH
jgi:hypothetical protein